MSKVLTMRINGVDSVVISVDRYVEMIMLIEEAEKEGDLKQYDKTERAYFENRGVAV